MRQKRIFVTGATGFIGSHLAVELSKENTVYVLARIPRKDNRDQELARHGITIVGGDLHTPAAYSEILRSCDYVFHAAALFQVDASKKALFQANVEGTGVLLSVCKNSSLKKFIFFSTAYVNAGTNERDAITEEEPYAAQPRNWYEWSKAKAEELVINKSQGFGLPFVILRPVIVYGERITNPNSILTAFKLCLYKRMILTDKGQNKLHFVAVEDVAQAAIHAAASEQCNNGIFNICDDHPWTQGGVIAQILETLHSSYKPPLLPKNLVKMGMRIIPCKKKLFHGFNASLADFFCDNHTFSNQKLKESGYKFLHPEVRERFGEVIQWYINHYLKD